jgi:hypothetical protein
MVDLGQDGACIVEERAASIGEFDATRLAAKQQDVELAFEGADLIAERRLLDAEPFRRRCDEAFLGDGDEVAQVAKLQLPYLSDMDFIVSILWTDQGGRITLGHGHQRSHGSIPRLGRGSSAHPRRRDGSLAHLPAPVLMGRRDDRRPRSAREPTGHTDGARPRRTGHGVASPW